MGRRINAVMGKLQQHGKRTPLRTCVVCREQMSKRFLFRVVHVEQGVIVDLSGKLNGRGAYLCDQKSCWEKAVNSNILNQALRVMLTDEDRERLQQAMPTS